MEMDNTFQVRCWMGGITANTDGKLDPKKALGAVKYAIALGDPLRPTEVESCMRTLLKGAASSFENKVSAISMARVTRKFLDRKAKIEHPEMNAYKKVLARDRAVDGFDEWDLLHKLIV
jgi:hypothetical protein